VLFAVLLAWVIYANPQAVTGAEPTDIGQVATNSVAYREGIRPGDRVLAVNGEEVDSWYRLAEEALLGAGDDGKIVLTVRSDGEERRVSVNVSTNQLSGQPIPGLSRARKCAVTNVSQTAANGLREGDIVISLNGKEVVSCQHLRHLSRGMEGEEATLTVRRGDAEVEVTAMLPIEGTSPYNRCMVGGVLDGSPADEAGLRAGDVIRTFDGVPVVNWRQFTASVDKHAGREVPISVWRNGKLVETEVTPEYDEDRGRALIGIALGVRPSLPWMRYRNPGAQIGHDASAIFRVLSALVNPEESRRAAGAIGGPLMILMTLWTSIKISMLNAVGFLRFLNVNLAILNLLPIPVLDGGHIIFSLWEGITRRRVNPKLVNILVNIFMVILLLLMLLITIRDIDRAFTGRAKQGGAKASETNKYSDAGAEPATIPTDSE
jgi:regulator of sigma E protease